MTTTERVDLTKKWSAPADAVPEPTAPASEQPAPGQTAPTSGPEPAAQQRTPRAQLLAIALGALAAVLAIAAVFLGMRWDTAASEADALRAQQADRDRAQQVAGDYTVRSLTYDHRNLPAFFDGVERDTSDALRKRYEDVRKTLSQIMTEAQVVATGEVIATSVEAKGNDQYTVTVFATQRTQNIQQTDPATVPNLLSVTVAKSGDAWQVLDYGPR